MPTSSLPPPPTPLVVAKPTVNLFSADPRTVIKGQSVSLSWSVKDADAVEIDNGIGPVAPDDRRQMQPTSTTSYTLKATKGSETTTAVVTVTVTNIAAPVASSAATQSGSSSQSIAEELAGDLRDIHFAYGEDNVVKEDSSILENDASALKKFFLQDPTLVVTIEGHCDERGSSEYNIGLGDRRANVVKTSLVSLGVPKTS